MNETIIPSYFIPHGGGPWNLLGEAYMKKSGEIHLQKYLQKLWAKYREVDAIIMVTSHWESKGISVSFNTEYDLLYDYNGFPSHTYNIDYKVKWEPKLAEKIEGLLSKNWIEVDRETARWLDHGSFVPLMVMYPDAKIPVVQVSISSSLSEELHYKLWESLSSLKQENILILGSWMSYHNMQWFFSQAPSYREDSLRFNEFLEENLNNTEVLFNWYSQDLSKRVHPRNEHFMPFFTILWTSLSWEIERDCKIDIYEKEVVWYKTI